jgi:hypothetical protein
MGQQRKNHTKISTITTKPSPPLIKSSLITIKKEGRKEGRTLNNNKRIAC